MPARRNGVELVPELSAIAKAFEADKKVAHFKSTSLCFDNKVFAMFVKGALVLKLPAARVSELAGSGQGRPYDPGSGKIMREWVSIPPAREQHWVALAKESRDFVKG